MRIAAGTLSPSWDSSSRRAPTGRTGGSGTPASATAWASGTPRAAFAAIALATARARSDACWLIQSSATRARMLASGAGAAATIRAGATRT